MTATIDRDTVLTPTAERVADLIARTDSPAAVNAAPAGVALLGYEINWNVSGVLVTVDELRELLGLFGLAAYAPKQPPTERKAARRAIAEWAEGRSGKAFVGDEDNADIVGRRRLIREVTGGRTKNGQIVFALVEEGKLGDALSLKYGVSYRFAIAPGPEGGKATLTVSTEARGVIGPDEREDRERERREVERQVGIAWEKHRDLYNGADVAKLLIEAVRAEGMAVAVESGSGVWFVPVEREYAVSRIEKFVAALPGASHCRVRENIDWPRTRAALSEAALDDLLAEVRRIETELAGMEEQTDANPGSLRATTARGLVQEMLAVKNKAAYYADTLGMRQERLDGDLNALARRAKAIAVKNTAARQEREQAARPVVVALPRQERGERLA